MPSATMVPMLNERSRSYGNLHGDFDTALPGPQPGLYEPARGFGKVWRENQAVRYCLGYATTPDETTYTIVSQQFLRGVLLTATTPTGQFVYVLYGGQPGAGGPFYERHIDPAP